MSKAPLKVKRCKYSNDIVSYDARMTKDCKGFNLRVEGGKPVAWVDYLVRIATWAADEIEGLKMSPDDQEH